MTETELRTMLRAWGRAFGPAPAKEWDEDSSEDLAGDTHVLMRAARVGTRTEPKRRKTRSYRAADGKTAFEPAPANVCYGKQSKSGSKPMWINPVAEQVEVAVLQLYATDRVKSIVLRMEYCAGRIGRSEKAVLASNALDLRITTRRYRHELELAHAYLMGRFSNARAA